MSLHFADCRQDKRIAEIIDFTCRFKSEMSSTAMIRIVCGVSVHRDIP